MARSRTAIFYDTHPKAKKHRVEVQQRRYDNGNGSTGKSKESINRKKKILGRWKRKHAGSKPKGKIVEAVHSASAPNSSTQIRWASGSAARKHNRGNEVRKRNQPSNPNGGRVA